MALVRLDRSAPPYWTPLLTPRGIHSDILALYKYSVAVLVAGIFTEDCH